ncbi:hypothetical protein ACF061_27820 [Streptomyces sp. NPDC015220]|uniref:hypothetical protein n=1 Tax=Streptomyces sp. NPDC015220 TaxID=3364947 RepID=UPI0037021B75
MEADHRTGCSIGLRTEERDMTVTWRNAVTYALTVVIGSWMIGAVVDLAWSAAAGSLGSWVSQWPTNSLSYVFLAAATLTLTLTRRFTPAAPQWRIPLVDGGAYLLILLLWAGLTAWQDGAAVPADDAFATAGFALLTLQLPAAWLLSTWRARHLDVAVRQCSKSAMAPSWGPSSEII